MNGKITVSRETFEDYGPDAKLMTLFDIVILLNDKIDAVSKHIEKRRLIYPTITAVGSFFGGFAAAATWLRFFQ